MAIDPTHWEVALNGDIRYTGADHGGGGATSYATVIEFHRWLQNLADDASYSEAAADRIDITLPTPSDRSTDNIITLQGAYNIDAASSEHLYNGSIIQDGGDTVYDGIVNYGNPDVQIQIHQDGAVLADPWWNYGGAGLNADATNGISHRFLILVRANGVDIDGRRLIGTTRTFGNTYGEFKINGTSNGNNVLALSDTSDLNNDTGAGTVATWTDIDNTTEGLALINMDNTGAAEEYYSEWNRAGYEINEFYERMKWLTREASGSTLYGMNGELFRGITHSFAYDGGVGGAPATGDKWVWGTKLDFDGSAGGTPFVVGDVLHETTATPVWKATVLAVDTTSLIVRIESGTITDNESFTTVRGSGEATADVQGTPTPVVEGGQVAFLAVDDDVTTGNMYVQVLQGPAPSDDIVVYDAADHTQLFLVNGAVTERAISTPFIGQSTGAALIGAYGVGIEYLDATNEDTFFDLAGGSNSPPNIVTFTVNGLEVGDRVLVTNDQAEGVDFDQLTLNATLNGGAVITVQMDAAIPADTPPTGNIRIHRVDGTYSLHPYSEWATDTFTITSHDFSTNPSNATGNTFVSYMDRTATGTSEEFQTVFGSIRTLFVRVRDGASGSPKKTFEVTSDLTATGGAATATKISDA